jgi:hypothetical protein
MLTSIKAWVASKGGFAHVAAALFAGAIAAYAEVPAFHSLVVSIYNLIPASGHELILALLGLMAWYKNTQSKPNITVATTQTISQDTSDSSVKLGVIALMCFTLLTVGLVGCTTWERTTYQSLAASKAVIDQAQADYEAGTIPKTQAAYKIINDAKKAQTTAVDAMVAYETVKASSATTATAQAMAQQEVITALSVIPQLVAEIKALYAPAASPAKTSQLTTSSTIHWIGGPLWT